MAMNDPAAESLPQKDKDTAVQPSSPQESLQQISTMVAELETIRRRQGLISALGVLVILVLIILFVVNLVGFSKRFDISACGTAFVADSNLIVQSPEVKQMQQDFQNVFIPAFEKSFRDNLQRKMPEIQKNLDAESSAFVKFLNDDLHGMLLKRVHAAFDKMEKDILKKYAGNEKENAELITALQEFEGVFIDDVSKTLEKNVAKARTSLTDLYGTVLSFKDLPEYSEVGKMPVGELENALIETFLELWIYHINPARGAAGIASAQGGI